MALFVAAEVFSAAGSASPQDRWTCPSELAPAGLAATSQTVARGAVLAHQSCAECHGETGRGDGPAASGMSPRPADWQSRDVQVQSDACLFWKLSTGRGNMPPGGRMPELDRWSIIHFIRSIKND